MKNAAAYGINLAHQPLVDWPAMLARKDKIVKGMVNGIGVLFKDYGVQHYDGFGYLVSDKKIRVELADGGQEEISARSIIIATGSRPANIPAFPLDGTNILSSDHLLTMDALPDSMLIIGAGVIGCEWAFMLAQLDVKIEMVEMMPRALPLEDDMASTIIARELKKLKIKLHLDTKVDTLEPENNRIKAILTNGQAVVADKILVSIGRAFNTAEIGLDKVGIVLNKNGSIKINDYMETSKRGIYAIGDVAGRVLLAYTAVAEGAVAVDNCLGEKRKMNYKSVPSVIFTQPEVASVGMTEAEAKKDHKVSVGTFPIRVLGKAHAEGEIAGEVKVIGDGQTDKLLGVHMVGPHVTESIHTAALAIEHGLTVSQLGSLIFAHPVISESIMEACHNLHKMSVHLPGQRK